MTASLGGDGTANNTHTVCNSRQPYSQEAPMLGGFTNIYTEFKKRGGSHKEAQDLVTTIIGCYGSAGVHSLSALAPRAPHLHSL